MKTNLLIGILATLFFISCSKDFIDDNQLDNDAGDISNVVLNNKKILYSDLNSIKLYDLDKKTIIWENGNYFFRAAPVLEGENIFFTDKYGAYSMNMTNGKIIWSYKTSNSVASSPLVVNGLVIFSNYNSGSLIALEQSSGKFKWKFTSKKYVNNTPDPDINLEYFPIEAAPTANNGVVVVGSHDGTIYGIKVSTGEKLWGFGTKGAITSNPCVVGNDVIVPSNDQYVYSINLVSGVLNWKYEFPNTSVLLNMFSTSVTASNETVVILSSNGNLIGLNQKNGLKKWQADVGGNSVSASPIIDRPNSIVYVNGDMKTVAINLQDGREIPNKTEPDSLSLFWLNAATNQNISPTFLKDLLISGQINRVGTECFIMDMKSKQILFRFLSKSSVVIIDKDVVAYPSDSGKEN